MKTQTEKKSLLAQMRQGATKTVVLGGSVLAGGMITLAVGTFTTNFPTEKVAGDKLSAGTWNDLMHTVNIVAAHFNDSDGKITADAPVADNEVATKAYVDAASPSILPTMISAASTTMNWRPALSYCADLSESGFDDWKMPTVEELAYVVGEENITDNVYYWTRTVGTSGSYWVSFRPSHGIWGSTTYSAGYAVRCVR